MEFLTTETPAKPAKRKSSLRSSGSATKAGVSLSFAVDLSDPAFSMKRTKSGSGKPLELRVKKQTKAAKQKQKKILKRSASSARRSSGSSKNGGMLPKTPAKEPRPQSPLKEFAKKPMAFDGQDDDKENAARTPRHGARGLLGHLAGAGKLALALAAPVLIAVARSQTGTRQAAMA